MSYFPKSKVNIKEALMGEFIYKENRKPFKGKYLELSNGKYYEGTDTINLGNELIKSVEELYEAVGKQVRTMPQIKIDGQLIGGYNQLVEHFADKGLVNYKGEKISG